MKKVLMTLIMALLAVNVFAANPLKVKDGDKTRYRVTTMPARFINQQAIVRFSLTDPYGMPFSPTNLTVTVGSTVKAKLTDIPASTYTTNGEGVLYVAIPNVSSNTVSLLASSPTELYIYEKESVSFKKGKFYSITVKMAMGNVDLSQLTADYTAKDGDILYGTLPPDLRLSIKSGAEVTLNGVTTQKSMDINSDFPGIRCKGDATIILAGTSTVTGSRDYYPGIYVPSGKTLTIQGDGTLNAIGYNRAAGIGGGDVSTDFKTCGNITITGGIVNATGDKGAGIGTGNNGTCGDIKITGGSVNATGGKYGAGIGGGYDGTCGNITIRHGSGTATKGTSATYCIGWAIHGKIGTVKVGKNNYKSGITDSPFTWSL